METCVISYTGFIDALDEHDEAAVMVERNVENVYLSVLSVMQDYGHTHQTAECVALDVVAQVRDGQYEVPLVCLTDKENLAGFLIAYAEVRGYARLNEVLGEELDPEVWNEVLAS